MMGAIEILKALKNGDELTSKEIAEKANIPLTALRKAIKRLLGDCSENLNVRVLTIKEKEEKYGWKLGRKVLVYRLIIKN